MKNRFFKVTLVCLMLMVAYSVHAQQPSRDGNARANSPGWQDKVKVMSDIPYAGTDNPRQKLDLILPANRNDERLPVIAFVHGGGWRNGSKDRSRSRVAPYVASGQYAAVCVGYRLSDEAQWPSQIHDCKAAIRWIRANADKYNLDADKIAAWGTSAGGHLVAVLGTSGDVPEMDGFLGPNTDYSSRVSCVLDFYGPTNFLTMDETAPPHARMKHSAPDSPESKLIGAPIVGNPDKVAAASPLSYVTKDDPPFLIVHGNMDATVSFNQSELLHAALNKAGVENTLITVNKGGHGQGFGPEVQALIGRFLEHHFHGKKHKWKDQTIEAVSFKTRN